VYVTVVVRRAGQKKPWQAFGLESYRGYDGTRVTTSFGYMPFRSGADGVITFETHIPGREWHRYEIDAGRMDRSQRCRLSLRA
jgi:hypothetical protein